MHEWQESIWYQSLGLSLLEIIARGVYQIHSYVCIGLQHCVAACGNAEIAKIAVYLLLQGLKAGPQYLQEFKLSLKNF